MLDTTKQPNPFEIVEELRRTYISTPRDEHFEELLRGVLCQDSNGEVLPQPRHYTKTMDTRGIMLISESGAGKTSLIHRALSQTPALRSSDPDRLPWIAVRPPSPATTKGLGLEVLRQSGYPMTSSRLNEREIWDRVRHRMIALGTAILWIDEAQDLFRTKSPLETRNILNTIKRQMQDVGSLVIILSGTDDLRQMAATDQQITRRFRTMTLPDISEEEQGPLLRDAIEHFCAKVGLEKPRSSDLVARLIHASRGRLGLCVETILCAIELALCCGDDALEDIHFAEHFANCTGCTSGDNVFLARGWSRINLDRLVVS